MPRKTRKISPINYYHVMTRGIDKQIIFEEDKDRRKYLQCVIDALNNYNIKLISYCLMINHVHLIIYDPENLKARFMQSLNCKYAWYFNTKYERIGPLFHDRYRSEPINDEHQLLAAYRYVMNNPWKSGICEACDYRWSSYSLYGKNNKIVDTQVLFEIIGENNLHKEFIESYSDDKFIDVAPSKYDDEEAKVLAQDILNLNSATELLNYSKERRNEGIVKLKLYGFTNKQIQRLTGASPGIIKRAFTDSRKTVSPRRKNDPKYSDPEAQKCAKKLRPHKGFLVEYVR